MSEIATLGAVALVILIVRIARRRDRPERIPNWEKRSYEAKRLCDDAADLPRTPRRYRR